MHKMDPNLVQLMHELESVEQSLKDPGNINFTKGSIKPKGWKQEEEEEGSDTSSKSVAMKKPKGKCFKCEQKGHWKQNCPKATKKPVVQT